MEYSTFWFYDQTYDFATLFCICRINIFACKNKLAKTDPVKESLLQKQTLSRMQKNRYKWIPKPELVDVINGLCHQRYEKRLEQQKSGSNVHSAEDNLDEQLPNN